MHPQQQDNARTASRLNSTTAPVDGGSVAGTTVVIEAVIDGDGEEQLEEDEEQPPLARGISSLTHSGSRDLGSCRGRGEDEAGPRWEANMQLDLAEFDANSVHYLAEVGGFWFLVVCACACWCRVEANQPCGRSL